MFGDPMILAVLSGRKTQTRRRGARRLQEATGFQISWDAGRPCWVGDVPTRPCPTRRVPGALFPGDLVWVKEAWTLTQFGKPVYRADARDADGNRWASIEPGDPAGEVAWRSTMRMPVWASRITLRIRTYRIERLHDITGPDALAEGVPVLPHLPEDGTDHDYALGRFRELWESIYGAGAWSRNIWVERIEFEPVFRNIRNVERT
jgi:hypothetical protein